MKPATALAVILATVSIPPCSRGGPIEAHDQAIAWLRSRVASVPYFSADEELLALMVDLEAALRS